MPGLRGPRGVQGAAGIGVDANGNLSATTINGYKPLTEPKHRFGLTVSSPLGVAVTREQWADIPAQSRALGMTEIELLHQPSTVKLPGAANICRPTIAEYTFFKQACDAAGVSITSVLVDNTANLITAAVQDCRPGSSNVFFRDQCVSFVTEMLPLYNYLGVKMIRFKTATGETDAIVGANPSLFYNNFLDTYTRVNVLTAPFGITVCGENEGTGFFGRPSSLIALYNVIAPAVPSFSYIVDTSNFDNTVVTDESAAAYLLAPYAYQFSLKVHPTDFGYTLPDGAAVAGPYTVDRQIALSSTGMTDLYKLMDIIDNQSLVPVKPKGPKFMFEYAVSDTLLGSGKVERAWDFHKRALLSLYNTYPKFVNNQSSMLNVVALGQADKDLNYFDLNIRTLIEQSQRNEEIATQERMENWQERTQAKIARGKKYHYIVVGAGSAGAAAAHALASFTRGQGKQVLLVERGAARPISYIGGATTGGQIGAGSATMNRVFGQYYIKEDPLITFKSNLLARVLDINVNANLPLTTNTQNLVNVVNKVAGPDGVDPYVFGGGSTFNGGVTNFSPEWYNERNCVRGSAVNIDNIIMKQCADFVIDTNGNKEDDFYVATREIGYSRILAKLETKTSYPWIGKATGEAKDEMLVSGVNLNVGGSSAESGGLRYSYRSLRLRSTGMSRRNGSASMIEQFDNNFFNLDVLTNAKCERIVFEKFVSGSNSYMLPLLTGIASQYVADANNAVVASGIEVIIDDLVDAADDTEADPVTTIKLKPGGEVFVAGNAYNAPVLLERSGIGQRAVIEACGLECIRENSHIGENFHNNYYLQRAMAGIRMVIPQGTHNRIDYNRYESDRDLRKQQGFSATLTYVISQHDDSDRSSFKTTRTHFVPAAESNVADFLPSGFDFEVFGGITNGNVHISNTATDITRPKINFGWFLNDKDGRRNVNGIVRALRKIHTQCTSNEAAYYFLGAGRDSSNNLIARDPDCVRESLLTNVILSSNTVYLSNPSHYFASSAGGVYNRGYLGWNMETATDDQLSNAFLNSAGSLKDAIHWQNTVSFGKATDKDFIVKGTRNVRCCCSAAMSEPFPHNNWGTTTQWGRYIAVHALGLTTILKPESRIEVALSNAVSNVVKFDLGVASSNLTITNYDVATSNLTYYITKDGVQFPSINAKFTAAKASGSNVLCNFRTVNDRYNGYDIPLAVGNYADADCGITYSKLQVEFVGAKLVKLPGDTAPVTIRLKHLYLAISAYDGSDKFVDTIAGVPLQPGMTRLTVNA